MSFCRLKIDIRLCTNLNKFTNLNTFNYYSLQLCLDIGSPSDTIDICCSIQLCVHLLSKNLITWHHTLKDFGDY